MRIGKFTAFISIAFLIITSLVMVMDVEGEPGTRPPPIKEGHIVADEIWDEDLVIYNLVIDEGVTVTVEPGVNLLFEEDIYFYVDGALIFNGTSAEPVNVRAMASGTTWDLFETNETGIFNFENFTVRGSTTDHVAFSHEGLPSVFKNGLIDGGYDGLYLWGDGGDYISNVTIMNTAYHGLVIYDNIRPTIVEDAEMNNITRSALFLVNNNGVEVNGMVADYELWGVYTFDTKGLMMNDIDFMGEPGSTGFVHINGLWDTHITNAIIRSGDHGVNFNTNEGSSANFTGFVTTDQVNIAVRTYGTGYIDARFTDCALESAALNSLVIQSTGSRQRVDLINSTWTWSKPILTDGNVFVNISWYLEGMFTDMSGESIDGTMNIYPSGSPIEDFILIEDGIIPMMEVKDRSISNMSVQDYSDEVFEYDLQFEPDDNDQQLSMENVWFTNYTYLEAVLNRAPTNSLPETIEFEEDNTSTTLNYTEYFQDDEELEYDIVSGPELDVHRKIHDGPHLEIMTNESNWYGTSWLNISATDSGGNSTFGNITVIVTPVNDIPIVSILHKNMTEAELKLNTTNEFILELLEGDDNVSFYLDVFDPDMDEINLTFDAMVLVHGRLSFDPNWTNVIEEVRYQKLLVYWGFGPDYNGMENLTFSITDGNEIIPVVVHFSVLPVNDPPVLSTPVDWNFTVEDEVHPVVDVGDLISDVDNEILTITVSPSSFATVNGTVITLTIPDDIAEDHVDIMVNVSDGELEDSAVLRVYLTNDTAPGPGPDDDINVTSLEIISGEDEWTINVYGDPDQTIFIVVEDEDGEKTDYPLVYEDGKYTVEIDSDDAEEGSTIYITDSPGGDDLIPELTDSLPELKEEKESNYMMYILIAILAIILLSVMVYLITRSKSEPDFEE